ncbi:hypothetical protein HK097_010064 [Rhizophlyctis rosea]|uniref:Uncharacterized protein n=1 Tax=Rhizophlyctis rosea TaxID=64517 RepID=A0AAD5X009_9FUNG|nr:hypothetical protein HK097_010064 [Rhizophlyctis rosea]
MPTQTSDPASSRQIPYRAAELMIYIHHFLAQDKSPLLLPLLESDRYGGPQFTLGSLLESGGFNKQDEKGRPMTLNSIFNYLVNTGIFKPIRVMYRLSYLGRADLISNWSIQITRVPALNHDPLPHPNLHRMLPVGTCVSRTEFAETARLLLDQISGHTYEPLDVEKQRLRGEYQKKQTTWAPGEAALSIQAYAKLVDMHVNERADGFCREGVIVAEIKTHISISHTPSPPSPRKLLRGPTTSGPSNADGGSCGGGRNSGGKTSRFVRSPEKVDAKGKGKDVEVDAKGKGKDVEVDAKGKGKVVEVPDEKQVGHQRGDQSED